MATLDELRRRFSVENASAEEEAERRRREVHAQLDDLLKCRRLANRHQRRRIDEILMQKNIKVAV